MDFLLECIGFPPDTSIEALIERGRREGEPAAWRGDPGRHRRLPLGGGLELRVDQDDTRGTWSVLPHYQSSRRLRVAVEDVRTLDDSPFDALLVGWAAPPISHEEALVAAGDGGWNDDTLSDPRGAYRLATFLTDARRLPSELAYRHVLAVSVAGFALDVTYVGPDAGGHDAAARERECGASIRPLGSDDDPGGCDEVSARVRRVVQLENPITRARVDLLELDAPERPLDVFVSRWQLETDGWPAPRPGDRIEGTFLFPGRIAGGLPGPKRTARGSFG
jgi:hypothetical protein